MLTSDSSDEPAAEPRSGDGSRPVSIDNLFKEPVKAFIKTASHFITGADGAYDAWEAPSAAAAHPAAKDKKGVNCKFKPVDKDVIWEEFKSFIIRLRQFREALINSITPSPVPNIKNAAAIGVIGVPDDTSNFVNKCFMLFADDSSKRQLLYSVILSYGVLSLLSPIIGKEAKGKHAVSLAFDHWDFGRKLRDIYIDSGASWEESGRIVDIVRALLNRAGYWSVDSIARNKWPKHDSSKSDSSVTGTSHDAVGVASLIIEANYNEDDFRRILGINFFDDAVWFNKEGFDATIFYSSLIFMVGGSSEISAEERLNLIAGIYEALVKAEEKSEYRFDILLDNLARGNSLQKSGKVKVNKKSANC